MLFSYRRQLASFLEGIVNTVAYSEILKVEAISGASFKTNTQSIHPWLFLDLNCKTNLVYFNNVE